jgi:hypothetical protein
MQVSPSGTITTIHSLPSDADFFTQLTVIDSNHLEVTFIEGGNSLNRPTATKGWLTRIGETVSPFAGIWKGKIDGHVSKLWIGRDGSFEEAEDNGSSEEGPYIAEDGDLGVKLMGSSEDMCSRLTRIDATHLLATYSHSRMRRSGDESGVTTTTGTYVRLTDRPLERSPFAGRWIGSIAFGGDPHSECLLMVSRNGFVTVMVKNSFVDWGNRVSRDGWLVKGDWMSTSHCVTRLAFVYSDQLNVTFSENGKVVTYAFTPLPR